MKSLYYIWLVYFTLGAFIPKGDFSQLLQLPDLLDHFKLHQEEAFQANEKCSFLDFMLLHFGSADDHHHPDNSDHENLPLQNISSPITFFLDTPDFSHQTFSLAHKVDLPPIQENAQAGVTKDVFHPPL